jgi:hypothetical protein
VGAVNVSARRGECRQGVWSGGRTERREARSRRRRRTGGGWFIHSNFIFFYLLFTTTTLLFSSLWLWCGVDWLVVYLEGKKKKEERLSS